MQVFVRCPHAFESAAYSLVTSLKCRCDNLPYDMALMEWLNCNSICHLNPQHAQRKNSNKNYRASPVFSKHVHFNFFHFVEWSKIKYWLWHFICCFVNFIMQHVFTDGIILMESRTKTVVRRVNIICLADNFYCAGTMITFMLEAFVDIR